MNRLAKIYAVRSLADGHFLRQQGSDGKNSIMHEGDMRYTILSKRMGAGRTAYWFYELRVVNVWSGSLLFFGNGTSLNAIMDEYERFHKDHEELHPVESIIPRTMYDSIW